MTKWQVILIVESETGISWLDIVQHPKNSRSLAREVIILMLREEGYQVKDIADLFGFKQSSVSHALIRINDQLTNDKEFKTLYLACIKRMADMEDQ